ncbi:MAG: polysaccharide deacetylase family protein [Syntrophobacteraceae bacterium]|jgi:peptidoglycan/xylan/chitin deacetylase (PgdA/CDA1 family)
MASLRNGQKISLAALVCALGMALVDLRLVLIPAVLFLFLCMVAPFLYRFSFYVPIISRGCTGQRVVALTFDDGPDPATTPHLLRLLAAHDSPATFFVVGQRAAAYPELIQAILDAGHTIGNHSFRHDSLVAFRGSKKIAAEILMAQCVLENLGVTPTVFRPPAGITYPGLAKVLARLGLVAVTFSCRALDRGNRSIGCMAERILGRARPDDIIMLHDHLPVPRQNVSQWLAEVEAILSGIPRKGLVFRPLSELIGRSVDCRPGHALRMLATSRAHNNMDT